MHVYTQTQSPKAERGEAKGEAVTAKKKIGFLLKALPATAAII